MKEPRIMFFDIETKPVKAWIWRTGKQYVPHNMIVDGEHFDIICICWKWLGEKKVHALDWGKSQNSKNMMKKFIKELESADVVIAQNGDAFDVKYVNTLALLHGLPPVAWPTTEDTRKMIRRHFYVTSSSLKYMSELLLEGDTKDRMQFQDWIDIVEDKDQKALDKMIKYCKKDVALTERVWKTIQPYVTPRVNRSLLVRGHKHGCPQCGHEHASKWGLRHTTTGSWQRLKCKSCFHVWKGPKVS